jgi:hypothetical protein
MLDANRERVATDATVGDILSVLPAPNIQCRHPVATTGGSASSNEELEMYSV